MPWDLLVLGLGNPGDRYAGTRHNVGADAVAEVARRHGGRLKADGKVNALVGDVRIGSSRVVLAVPTTYMNDSGQSAVALVRRYEVDDLSRLVVAHDELDLEQGRVKVKVGGGLAGHNGLRSLDAHLHAADFVRVRMGVGKPPGGPDRGADWVLSKVRGRTRDELDVMVGIAADAIELIATDGVDAAMQRMNQRP
ncbi:aminoacyl-tRNA hydrolase [Dermatobacter hominis]|uniref:aminoacyl-tRNA hydrolase n=1 Tax=Dermatobacter hominis TaxID=2884263 RepID=UPI001D0FE10E|nr:aminoacyl-tRNA hydrolase [Dermatobacter hominis]UDY37697.1 aminoacyl-tRNA hydrolase [Dermatobacter hominis]